MRLLKDDEVIIIPGYGFANLYRTLKPTRYSLYVPHLSILVKEQIVEAVMIFYQRGGFASMGLEEYLARMYF